MLDLYDLAEYHDHNYSENFIWVCVLMSLLITIFHVAQTSLSKFPSTQGRLS